MKVHRSAIMQVSIYQFYIFVGYFHLLHALNCKRQNSVNMRWWFGIFGNIHDVWYVHRKWLACFGQMLRLIKLECWTRNRHFFHIIVEFPKFTYSPYTVWRFFWRISHKKQIYQRNHFNISYECVCIFCVYRPTEIVDFDMVLSTILFYLLSTSHGQIPKLVYIFSLLSRSFYLALFFALCFSLVSFSLVFFFLRNFHCNKTSQLVFVM